MAIVKMKKLRLMAIRSQKDPLLRELERFGCVEFSELDESLSDEGLVHENADILSLRSTQSTLQNAIGLLDRYAPEKKPLLSAKPQVETDALLDDSGLKTVLEKAAEISGLEEKIKRLTAEENRQSSLIESVKPWMELDLPLDTASTERSAILWGSIPARIDLQSVIAAVEEASDEAELFRISGDKTTNYVLVVAIREDLPAVQDSLRHFGFTAITFPGESGTAKEAAAEAANRLNVLASEKESVRQALIAKAPERDELKLAAEVAAAKIARAEAESKLMGLDSAVVMQGWVPAEKEAALADLLEPYDCAWETEDPDPSEYPDVPVLLKNNRFSDALNMVTNMYSLPAYDGVDPNPLMAPFFILFYGLMMADMGYGLIMMIAALVAMAKIKPQKGTLSFCRLLLYGGISTFIMGALTGGFFGNALEQIGKILGKPEGWGVLPSLFNPMTDSMIVLIGSMALGLIHLNTGMVISAVEKVKKGDAASAFWEEGSLWITLVGIVLFALNKTVAPQIPAGIGKWILIIGCLMVLFGGTRGAKGFGKFTSIFGTLYNTVTGWFGDILSYSRIMALMLAGSVIATVFNTIGGIANNLVFFLIIFLIGHALNFALNLLGCYVHDLRLQCLEYFGKFYKDGGRAFAPLAVNPKYYDIPAGE
ncbi:MAG: V-type ATP synthase subunit I [Oscillospiraceae bacterium]|nr:V-type ATP synthase subunit I [Oscillospiraceae bacterium]